MTQDEKLDRFEKLVSDKPSNFLSKMAEYEKNQKWLDKSSEIAANILEVLKDKKLSQKDLAEKLEISAQHVSKIIKGQQNLTLETITKIEEALNVSLLNVVEYKNTNTIEVKPTTVKSKKPLQTKEEITTKQNNTEEIKSTSPTKAKMSIIHNSKYNPKEEFLIVA